MIYSVARLRPLRVGSGRYSRSAIGHKRALEPDEKIIERSSVCLAR